MAEIVRVDGLRELEQVMLRDLPKAIAKNALQRGLKKAAQPFADDWRAHAPRDKGQLQASIIVGPSSKLTRRQRGDAKKEGTYFAEMHIGTADPAGLFQEFGTFSNTAQPSGRPTWEAHKQSVLQAIIKDMWAEIEKAAARRAKKYG